MGFGVPFNPKPFCDSESPLCGVSAAPQFSLGSALCAGSASLPETLFVIQQLQEVPEWRQEQLILGTRYTQLVGWINEPLEWSLTSPWGNAGAGGSTGVGQHRGGIPSGCPCCSARGGAGDPLELCGCSRKTPLWRKPPGIDRVRSRAAGIWESCNTLCSFGCCELWLVQALKLTLISQLVPQVFAARMK